MPFVVDASIRQVNAHTTSDQRQGDGSRAKLRLRDPHRRQRGQPAARSSTSGSPRLLEGGRLDPNTGSAEPGRLRRLPARDARPRGGRAVHRRAGLRRLSGVHAPSTTPTRRPGSTPAGRSYPGLMDRAQLPFDTAGAERARPTSRSATTTVSCRATRTRTPESRIDRDRLHQGDRAVAERERAVRLVLDHASDQSTPRRPSWSRRTRAASCVDQAGVRAAVRDRAAGRRARLRLRRPGRAGRLARRRELLRLLPAQGPAADLARHGLRGRRRPGRRPTATSTIPQFQWLDAPAQGGAGRRRARRPVQPSRARSRSASTVPDESAPALPDAGPARPTTPTPAATSTRAILEPVHAGAEHGRARPAAAPARDRLGRRPLARQRRRSAYSRKDGGFWVIRTSAEADWPHQDRLIELMDNRDGTLSIFGTLIDNAGAGAGAAAGDTGGRAQRRPARRRSRARSATTTRRTGGGTGEGEPEDHNVELLLARPARRSRAAPAARSPVRGPGCSRDATPDARALGPADALPRARARRGKLRAQRPRDGSRAHADDRAWALRGADPRHTAASAGRATRKG